MNDKQTMLRHFLATLAYRFQKAIRDAPDGFEDFDAGHGVRTPADIVRHMTHNLMFAYRDFVSGTVTAPPPLDWSDEVERFHRTLAQIDGCLEKGIHPHSTTLERLLQGPLSDVMTHVGQIAMLRRLANAPVPGENFRVAEIEIGQVSEKQPLPAKPTK